MPIMGTMIAVKTNVRSGNGQPSVSGNATGISTLISGYTNNQLRSKSFHFLGGVVEFMAAKVRVWP